MTLFRPSVQGLPLPKDIVGQMQNSYPMGLVITEINLNPPEVPCHPSHSVIFRYHDAQTYALDLFLLSFHGHLP